MKKSSSPIAAAAAVCLCCLISACATPGNSIPNPKVATEAVLKKQSPALAGKSLGQHIGAPMAGVLLAPEFEVSAGASDNGHYLGIITVHLTADFVFTKYVELNFYTPGQSFAYYQDGRFHLGFGSEMFGAVLAMLRSGEKLYFYFDKEVLQGLAQNGHSEMAEFGFLSTQAGWPY